MNTYTWKNYHIDGEPNRNGRFIFMRRDNYITYQIGEWSQYHSAWLSIGGYILYLHEWEYYTPVPRHPDNPMIGG